MNATDQMPVIHWLHDGDPAIRWQTLRDLMGADASSIARERNKVAREGWGARLLARQEAQGTWGGGLYLPKWTSTTYTLLLLRDFGLPTTNSQAPRACELLLNDGLRPDGGVNYGRTPRSETCITGMALSIFSFFEYEDERVDRLADYLLSEQMPDGGWNCLRRQGARHSSVHTTISVLEGLRLYAAYRGGKPGAVHAAESRGQEFLLTHHLFRSDHTGEVIDPAFLRFSFPPRWRYDVLRALDYFQSTKAPRDERLAEAIQMVRERQRRDGRWPLENNHRGATHFALERVGAPCYWNTLRALRVLRWWESPRR